MSLPSHGITSARAPAQLLADSGLGFHGDISTESLVLLAVAKVLWLLCQVCSHSFLVRVWIPFRSVDFIESWNSLGQKGP